MAMNPSDASLHCLVCDRRRACFDHRRAQAPAYNAYNWLVKTCTDTMAPLCCYINYEPHGDTTPYLLPAGIANRADVLED